MNKKLLKGKIMKYKEIIMYLIFGTLTTAVNIVVYYLFSILYILTIYFRML